MMSWEGSGRVPCPSWSENRGKAMWVRLLWAASLVTGVCTGTRCCDSHIPTRHDGSVAEELFEQSAILRLLPAAKPCARTNTNCPSLNPLAGATSTEGQGADLQGRVTVQPPLPSLAQTGAAPTTAGLWPVRAEVALIAVRATTDRTMQMAMVKIRRRDGR